MQITSNDEEGKITLEVDHTEFTMMFISVWAFVRGDDSEVDATAPQAIVNVLDEMEVIFHDKVARIRPNAKDN